MPDNVTSKPKYTPFSKYWDYGPEVDGTKLEVEVVDCEYNRMVQAKLDAPTSLPEIGF